MNVVYIHDATDTYKLLLYCFGLMRNNVGALKQIFDHFREHFIQENTVKLGNNDHGYNEFTAITIYISKIFGSLMFSLVHKASQI
jgi:hypothetical protein